MKLDCLFAHAKSFPNLGVCQPFNTTKSHLRFAPAQRHVLSQSGDRPIKGTIALAAINPLPVNTQPQFAHFMSPCNYFVRLVDAVDTRLLALAIPICSRAALYAQLRQ